VLPLALDGDGSRRAAAVELADGRLRFSGALPPEDAVSDPDGFLAPLDTEVYWEVA
jgi:hypothetical protein